MVRSETFDQKKASFTWQNTKHVASAQERRSKHDLLRTLSLSLSLNMEPCRDDCDELGVHGVQSVFPFEVVLYYVGSRCC
jgi:hypothetical protein